MEHEQPAAPRLQIEPAACQPGPGPGRWLAGWRIRNPGPEPVELLQMWLPHGRFRTESRTPEPPVTLEPQASSELQLMVAADEPPETTVENAFLILRLQWRGRPWRVFARHRVEFGPDGVPRPVCETVTIHPVDGT